MAGSSFCWGVFTSLHVASMIWLAGKRSGRIADMKEKTLPKQLLSLKAKTSWSWERMCREFHRVMDEEGPSHTTLFRYATGKVKQHNVLIERYVQQAIETVTAELSKK